MNKTLFSKFLVTTTSLSIAETFTIIDRKEKDNYYCAKRTKYKEYTSLKSKYLITQ